MDRIPKNDKYQSAFPCGGSLSEQSEIPYQIGNSNLLPKGPRGDTTPRAPGEGGVAAAQSVLQARWPAGVAFLVWFAFVLPAVFQHVVWRDEVRGLSLALQGQGVIEMLQAIHGEGHPAVWYLMLRAAHIFIPRPQVLQGLAFVVAALAMLLLALRSPFKWPLVALIMASHFALFEYSVVARNYGVSMLLMFLFAAIYERCRNKGPYLGLVLFLLSNCNVHSVVLSGALLVFWLLDLLTERGLQRHQALRVFCVNALIAATGMAVCGLTVFPTFNTAGSPNFTPAGLVSATLEAILLPGSELYSVGWPVGTASPLARLVLDAVTAALLVGSCLGLSARPAAAIAAGAALIGRAPLVALGVQNGYRHDALWLVLLIALYWMVQARPAPQSPTKASRLSTWIAPGGRAAFGLLLAGQALIGAFDAAAALHPAIPYSRSRDVAGLIQSRPELRGSVVVADPDYLVEALPYYISNPLYLVRENRFGAVVRFSRTSKMRLGLGELLQTARRLRRQSGHPVVILMQTHLDELDPEDEAVSESYAWTLSFSAGDIKDFRASTRLLARLGPSISEETYDAYELP